MKNGLIKKNISSLLFCICSLLNTILYADEEMIFKPTLNETVVQEKSLIAATKYDPKIYELAYKTFLYSGNVNDAFYLSLRAVEQVPDSLTWRERLVQTAIWTNHVDVALDQLTYLIKTSHQPIFLAQAIKMAKDLSRFDSLIPLLEYQYHQSPNDVSITIDLGMAYDHSGQPERAIEFLRQANTRKPDKKYLQAIANIYHEMGAIQSELAVLKEIQEEYGLSPNEAMILAEVNYNQAHLESALSDLNQQSIKSNLPGAANYYSMQADLSWIVGNEEVSRHAYYKLYQMDHLNQEGFSRLLLLQPRNANHETLAIATKAWQKFQITEAFLQAINFAMDLRDWQALKKLYALPMSNVARKKLVLSVDYWSGQASLLQHEGKSAGARKLLLEASLAYPQNKALHLFYLNFLETQLTLFINHEQQPEFFLSALAFWQKRASSTDEWAEMYARAFLLFDQPRLALRVYAAERFSFTHSPAWYNSYAQILEELTFRKSAYEVRLANWQRLQKQLFLNGEKDLDFWQTYSELATYFSPLIISYPLANYLLIHNSSANAADNLMSWAIQHNNYELASYLAAYYYPNGLPGWAILRLAIMRNDRETMRNLLRTMPETLPRKDRVEAAGMIDETGLAQNFAYEGMQHSHDADRYKLLVDTFLQTANIVTSKFEYEQFGAIQGPRLVLNGKFPLSPHLHLDPYISIWDPKTNNSGNIASHSYLEKFAGLVIAGKTKRLNIEGDLAWHHALYNYYSEEIRANYNLTSKLMVNGKAGYNQRTTLNTFMLVAGTQDEFLGGFNYDLATYDKFGGAAEIDYYHLQDRTTLGNGMLFSGEYDHKFALEYPDFTWRFMAAIDRFNHTNSLIQGRVLSIFPSDVTPTAQNLLTQNYWQLGTNFTFGDAIREDYTHAFRPYADLGVLYASTSGYGTDVDVGVAGSVWGRDKLALYFTRASSNQGTSQVNFLIGLRYQIYF